MAENIKKPEVYIVNGMGNAAKTYDYIENETITQLLSRAGIRIEHGNTVSLGRKRVKNTDKVIVKPNDTLVIAHKISNGI